MKKGWKLLLLTATLALVALAPWAHAAEEKDGARFPYQLEYLFSYNAKLSLEVIGEVPEGFRWNFYAIGGEVSGPKVQGKMRPVGGDWGLLYRNGVETLDVRATIETEDGALIYTTYTGVVDLGEDGYQSVLEGKPGPRFTPIRMAARYQTAHPKYLWINRLQCLGIGQYDAEKDEVRYDIYAVR